MTQVPHADRDGSEWTGERFAVRAVAESLRANSWKDRAEFAESVARGQQVEIREQARIIDAVRAEVAAMRRDAAGLIAKRGLILPEVGRLVGELVQNFDAILDADAEPVRIVGSGPIHTTVPVPPRETPTGAAK